MIACWFHKKAIAHSIDTTQALPERTQRHVRNCHVCRQFCELERELTRQLVAGAGLRSQTPPPFLHAKILASLDRPSPMTPSHSRVPAPAWAAAFLIVALGLFSVLFIRHLENPVLEGPPAGQSPPGPHPVVRQFANHLSALSGRDLIEWSTDLDQPLQTEMQSVLSDAKTAIHLLAQNFLPDLE